jgi:hypothetical protein
MFLLRKTEYGINKPPITMKQATVTLVSNHAVHCNVCNWYVFLAF